MKKVFSSYNFFLLITILVSIFSVLPTFGRSMVVGIWGVGALTLIITGYKIYERKSLVVLLSFISLYFFYLMSVLYSSDITQAGEHLFRRLPLLLFPTLFFFVPVTINGVDKQRVLNVFSYSLVVFVYGVIFYLLSTGIIDEMKTWPNQTVFIRHKLEEFTRLHPAYLSLFSAFAFVNILISALDSWSGSSFIQRVLSLVVLSSIIIIIMLLSAKMSIMALIIVVPVILIIKSKRNRRSALLMAGVVSFVFLIIIALPNTRFRFGNMVKALISSEADIRNPDSVRKDVYRSTFRVIAENPVAGIGIGDVEEELQSQYMDDGHEKALKDRFNSHNQYLEILLSTGILGLLSFLFSLLVGVLLSVINKDYRYLAFLMLSSMALLTENILSRQAGVLFFAFFNSFFAFSYGRSDKKYINARFLTHRLTGVQRFAFEISKELKTQSNIELLAPVNVNNDSAIDSMCFKSLPFLTSHLWEQVALPFYLSLKGNPLLINLCNTAPLLYRNKVVTVHDIAFEYNPAWFSKNMVTFYKFLIPRICRKSKKIFTVSEFSKNEIVKCYGVDASKIEVVYNALPKVFESDKLQEVNNEFGNYILTVGSLEPRKNINNIIKAFNLIDNQDLTLVVAGGFNKNVFKESGISQDLNDKIKIVENPDDEKLSQLYSNAKAFVYIPHYEGFGIPVLEAMSFNCPCIISDIEVFREVYNDAAYYVNKDSITDIAEVFIQIAAGDMSGFVSSKESFSKILSSYSYAESARKYNFATL